MNACKDGLNRMHAIIARAFGDIRHRLWSFYWLARMTHIPGNVIVELGVRGGDSTRALLAACVDLGDGLLISYDIEDCSGQVTDPVLTERWQFNLKDSIQAGLDFALGTKRPPRVDMVFIDTDHLYRTTRGEIAAWHQHVRYGGCLVFHDYWLDDPGRPEHGHGVKQAVDEFTNTRHPEWVLETWDAGPEGDTGGAVIWHKQ
jgi:predicted O-methyltransferase YrrM